MEEAEESLQAGDEGDPVVKEIPIYLSKRLEKQLYVFQYPLRPKELKTEMSIRKSFFKPQNKEVKLEMNVNVESSNFDPIKAEDIAQEVDGVKGNKKKEKDITFENDILDKVLLTSTKVVHDTDKYAIGVYNGKEYHITPLEGFLQLRPSLEYLDKCVKRKRDAQEIDEEEAGPSNAEAVTVKFARTETERQIKSREVSYKKLKEKSEAEKWIQCKWHQFKSTTSEVMKHKLLSETFDDNGQAMNITSSEYLKILVPDDQEQAIITPSLPSNVVSLHALRALPVLEQCRLLLKDAKIIQFQQLMMLLAGGEGVTSDALLKSLPQVGVLVRGNWIVKSEILYPQNSFSAISGVPADMMCRARDYVLYLFTQNQYVERRKVCSIIRLPTEEVKEIFTGISKLRHNKGWELVLPIDVDFMSKHTELVQRQVLMWEQRSKQLCELFKDVPNTTKTSEKRQRRKSKSVSDSMESKKETVDNKKESTENKKATENKKESTENKKELTAINKNEMKETESKSAR